MDFAKRIRSVMMICCLLLLLTAAVFFLGFLHLGVCIILMLAETGVIVYLHRSLLKPLIDFDHALDRCIDNSVESSEIFTNVSDNLLFMMKVNLLVDKCSNQKIRDNMTKVFDKQAELTALQSQINPHFLYNTLESIRGQVLLDGNEETAKMIETLASFFRYSISRKGNFVTFRDELANIQNYMMIQRYRFNNRFSLEILIDDEDAKAYDYNIPKLIIQPIVENAIYHGLENRLEGGKVVIEVIVTEKILIITISDNGKGINKDKVLAKAKENGILTKDESEYTDKEIYNLIMAPGFSMKEQVTEFSGRGVGTDVVKKNIEKIGGTVYVESKFGEGTSFIIKIPLSLAIVEGMEVSVGDSIFTIPTSTVRESFKIKEKQLIHDTDKGEMIMIRGTCYPLIRLHRIYDIKPKSENLTEGIVTLVEADGKATCLFADELIGEQQVVVKPFSPLLNKYNVKKNGMAGCSILGDGSITIILDINNIISEF